MCGKTPALALSRSIAFTQVLWKNVDNRSRVRVNKTEKERVSSYSLENSWENIEIGCAPSTDSKAHTNTCITTRWKRGLREKNREGEGFTTAIYRLTRDYQRCIDTMLLLCVFIECLQFIVGFRGPHHPRSSISHHHYTPQSGVKITQDSQLLHDTAHLVEDMGDFAEHIDVSKMTDQELDFYYFKAHDTDNNTKLDGLEMLHAIQHTFHENEDGEEAETNDNQMSLIIELIDRVLEEDDLNNDGYLGYIEYILARQKTTENPDQLTNELKLDMK